MLVPAVLGPEQGEDGELEVVRSAAEQGMDAVVLLVRQAESAMERLIRNAAQASSLTGGSDRLLRLHRLRTTRGLTSAAARLIRSPTVAVTFRRAREDDVDFLVDLVTHEEVEPFLAAVGSRNHDEIRAEVERSENDPDAFGVFVIEVDGEPAGTMRFERTNVRSRIAHLSGLAVHPGFRGHRVADVAARALQRHLIFDLDLHRLQLEVYGFNERAQQHAERSGFVREGVRRKAYWRDGQWADGVLYGLVAEDLDDTPTPPSD